MKSSCLVLSLLFCLVTTTDCFCQAHSPYTTPDDQGKVRGYLEQDFQRITGACFGASNLKKAKVDGDRVKVDGGVISSIPEPLPGDLKRFNTPVPAPAGKSPGTVFAKIFTDEEMPGNGNISFIDNSMLKALDYEQDPVSMLPKGASSVFYTHNCSSILSADLSADGKVSFPVATFKAALDAKASKDKDLSIALTEGVFNSPLGKYLLSTDNKARTFGAFLAWTFYVNNPDRADMKNHYLLSFDGVAVYRLQTNKSNVHTDASVSAGTSFGVAQASSTVKASVSSEDQIAITDYETMFTVAPGGNWGPFRDLPSAKDLAGTLSNAQLVIDETPSIQVPSDTTDYKWTVHVDGVPKSLCVSGNWRVIDTLKDGGVNYEYSLGDPESYLLPSTANVNDVSAPSGCRWPVHLTPMSLLK